MAQRIATTAADAIAARTADAGAARAALHLAEADEAAVRLNAERLLDEMAFRTSTRAAAARASWCAADAVAARAAPDVAEVDEAAIPVDPQAAGEDVAIGLAADAAGTEAAGAGGAIAARLAILRAAGAVAAGTTRAGTAARAPDAVTASAADDVAEDDQAAVARDRERLLKQVALGVAARAAPADAAAAPVPAITAIATRGAAAHRRDAAIPTRAAITAIAARTAGAGATRATGHIAEVDDAESGVEPDADAAGEDVAGGIATQAADARSAGSAMAALAAGASVRATRRAAADDGAPISATATATAIAAVTAGAGPASPARHIVEADNAYRPDQLDVAMVREAEGIATIAANRVAARAAIAPAAALAAVDRADPRRTVARRGEDGGRRGTGIGLKRDGSAVQRRPVVRHRPLPVEQNRSRDHRSGTPCAAEDRSRPGTTLRAFTAPIAISRRRLLHNYGARNPDFTVIGHTP
jgi:hypothetical protein